MAQDNPVLSPNAAAGKTLQALLDIAPGTIGTAADHTIIAAPPTGYRLVIVDFAIQGETDNETLVTVKAGSTAKRRKIIVGKACLVVVGEQNREWRLPAATALVVTLGSANSCNYDGTYFVEPV